MWSSALCSHSSVRDHARIKAGLPPAYTCPDIVKAAASSTASADPTERGMMHSQEVVLSPHFQNQLVSPSIRETLASLEGVLSAWRKGAIAQVDHALTFCDDYLDSQNMEMVPYFVGCGGVDLFCQLLCDPVTFTGRRARDYYIRVLSCFVVILTEIIVRHNNISWYIYDRYPGVFFRLLDLLGVAHLNNVALSMLEHLLSVVGPVLEIAKVPSLIALIRSPAPYLLGGLCRALALLVIPGSALQQSCMPSRHLLHPEGIEPIRRVQRVVDSNALWLQSEASLVERLIKLCEVRSKEIRVQQGGRTTTVMPQGQAQRSTNANEGDAVIRNELADFVAQMAQLPEGDQTVMLRLQSQLSAFLQNAADGGGGTGLLNMMLGGAGTTARAANNNNNNTNDNDADLEWFNDYSDDEEDEDDEWYDEEDGGDGEDDEWESASATNTEDDEEEYGTEASTEVLNSIHVPSPRNVISTSSSSFWEAPASPAAADSGHRDAAIVSSHAPLSPPPADNHSASATSTRPGQNPPVASTAPQPQPQPQASSAAVTAVSGITSSDAQDAAVQVVQELINEEAMIESELNTKIDLNWFYGSVDARERWRLRDLTLTPEKDDTRPMQYGYGSLRDEAAFEAFRARDKANLEFLCANQNESEFRFMARTFKYQTVDSQSEVLYLINMLLSTFYFSDGWYALKQCNWLKRANKIYNSSFGIGKDAALSVDVPRNVDVPAYIRKMPRFQSPNAPATGTGTATPQLPPSTPTPPGAQDPLPTSPSARPSPPSHWPLGPFHDMLGRKKYAFMSDSSVQMLQDEDDFGDETEHQHSPDTVRKLELLRGLHSFWNAQNTAESAMLDDDVMPKQAAKVTLKVARMLATNKEDPCVEAAACSVLETYLRTFTHNARLHGDWRGEPARRIADVVLLNLLHVRVYNATLVPSLSESIRPLRRFENTFSLLGELFQYNLPNLLTLAQHLDDAVPLEQLNESCKPVNRKDVLLFAPTKPIDSIFISPPLERQEHEPFGSVLLRRIYKYGCETHLTVSALLLSLTPGLRSKHNYIHRAVPRAGEDAATVQTSQACLSRWVPARLPSTPNGRVGDLVTGFSRRFAEVRRLSRYYAEQLSLAVLPFSTTPGSPSTPLALASLPLHDGAWRCAVTPILESLMAQLRSLPHRLAPEEQLFLDLYNDADAALLRGERGLQGCGPPVAWRVPLFGDDGLDAAEKEASQLAQLASVQTYLLGEPHKFLYSLLCSLNAETMDSTARMSVITTTIFTFMREAQLHPTDPEGAIHVLLKDIAVLAAPAYKTWRRQCRDAASARQPGTATNSPSTATSTQLRPAQAVNASPAYALPPPQASRTDHHSHHSAAAAAPPVLNTTQCTCPEALRDPHHRCLAFVMFGTCHPPSAADHYYRHYGGCFFRNLFRLLCVWFGHYWSCQRYVDTVFFYTEVAFAEYKNIALYLLRELPQYFSAPLLDA